MKKKHIIPFWLTGVIKFFTSLLNVAKRLDYCKIEVVKLFQYGYMTVVQRLYNSYVGPMKP